MAEKKICTIPPTRIDEETLNELRLLSSAQDVSVSWLVRKGIALLLENERDKYEALHSIFAGKDRRSNPFRVGQCDAFEYGD